MAQNNITHPDVAAVFATYPPHINAKLRHLRQLILDVAAETEGVGELEEMLKWGQPSYLTPITRSGSTIRIDAVRGRANHYAMYFNCKTMLVDSFRQMYANCFDFEANRALVFAVDKDIPVDALKHCIALALTYHLRKK